MHLENKAYATTTVIQNKEDILSLLKEEKEFSFHIFSFDVMKIEDAKYVRNIMQTGLSGENIVCVVQATSINEEAQNSLLKILEEPPSSLTILLSIYSLESLLPTVLSRVHILEGEVKDSTHNEFIKEFLHSDLSSRLGTIKKVPKKNHTHQFLLSVSKYCLEIMRKNNPETNELGRIIRFIELLHTNPEIPWKRAMDYLAVIVPEQKTK
jgi:DNA polymerase III delta prime subunit